MGAMVSQITIVYSTVYWGAGQRKHQSSASLAFVQGIHRWPVNSPHKGPVTRKCFHLMTSSCRGLCMDCSDELFMRSREGYFGVYFWGNEHNNNLRVHVSSARSAYVLLMTSQPITQVITWRHNCDTSMHCMTSQLDCDASMWKWYDIFADIINKPTLGVRYG